MLSIVRSEAVSPRNSPGSIGPIRSRFGPDADGKCLRFVPELDIVSRGVFDAVADQFPFEYVVQPLARYVNRVGWKKRKSRGWQLTSPTHVGRYDEVENKLCSLTENVERSLRISPLGSGCRSHLSGTDARYQGHGTRSDESIFGFG